MVDVTAPATEAILQAEEVIAAQSPWVTIVWNDPVNLMSYVTCVFMKLLGHPKDKAEKLMSDVHHKGRAAVCSGTAGGDGGTTSRSSRVPGLWATLQQDG